MHGQSVRCIRNREEMEAINSRGYAHSGAGTGAVIGRRVKQRGLRGLTARVAGVRPLAVLKAAAVTLAITGAAAVCAVLALCDIRTMHVSGNSVYSDEEMKEIFGSGLFGSNTAALALRYNGQAVNVPFIESVDVIMLDAHTVQINVTEKNIAARIEADSGEYIYIDSEGVVQEISTKYVADYPKEVGLAISSAVSGSEVAAESAGDYLYLCSVMQLLEKFEFSADKISVHPESGIDLRFGDVTVQLGKNENTSLKMAALRTLVPHLSDREGTVDLSMYTSSDDYIVLK